MVNEIKKKTILIMVWIWILMAESKLAVVFSSEHIPPLKELLG